MKVSLIQPQKTGEIQYLIMEQPHSGLGYLAAVAEQSGVSVQVLDCKLLGIDNDECVRRVGKFRPDVVGITARTPDIVDAACLAEDIRKKVGCFKTVLAGAHVTGSGVECLREFEVFDLAVIGEGEVVWRSLLDLWRNGADQSEISNLPGLVYREGRKVRENSPAQYIDDLDSLPFPAWHLFGRLTNTLPVFATRGCPYRCVFCQRVMGNKLRKRSPKIVVSEIRRNHEEFGMTYCCITDETFGLDRRWTEAFITELRQAGLHQKIRWQANSRVNIANRETYAMMKGAGCELVEFGIESGSQPVIDRIRKGFKLEQAKNAIATAKDVGLKTSAFFILGHPYESRDDIRKTIDLAVQLNPEKVCFGMMVPYPGTEIYEMVLRGEGGYVMKLTSWSSYVKYAGDGLALKHISRLQLETYQILAYLTFFFKTLRWRELLLFAWEHRQAAKAQLLKILSRFFGE